MISKRFLVPVCALFALACVPTVIHSYLGAIADDGLRTAAIPTVLAGRDSSVVKRPANWGREIYDSHDWIERTYGRQPQAEIRLFVARSYDLKRLYHHPELAVLRGADLARERLSRLTMGDESVPVLVLDGANGRGVAAYVLLYNNGYVARPLRFQLETALELLVSERKAMTLFLAYDKFADPADPFQSSAVANVLREAIHAFLAQAPVAVAQPHGR